MTLNPFWHAPFIIQAHVLLALMAIVLGAYQLLRPKGGITHRIMGRVWVGVIAGVSLSSFFIRPAPNVIPLLPFAPDFSLIHILSLVTLISLFIGVKMAWTKNYKAHKYCMVSLYFNALILTGVFTFAPGRLMYRLFW